MKTSEGNTTAAEALLLRDRWITIAGVVVLTLLAWWYVLAGAGKLVWRIDWPARWMMLGVSVEPFILAVLFGANMSFATPYGYQTNLLVMTAGGYKFGDYWRMGLPLEVLIVVVSVPLILWAWPL